MEQFLNQIKAHMDGGQGKDGASTLPKGQTTVKSILYDNGASYHGEVVQNVPHGRGTYTYSGGDTYEGDFVNGQKTGRGKYTSKSGWYYEGDFVNGNFNGRGVYHYEDGSIYEGDYVEDQRTGWGRLTSASGWRYEGEYRDGKFHGRGTYFFSNGDTYEGDFVAGNFHGDGKYTYADGTYYTGRWENDKNITRSATQSAASKPATSSIPRFSDFATPARETKRITYQSGNVYDGEVSNGKPHGKGTYTFANGDVYEGDFVDGNFNGQGTYRFASGSVFVGAWRNDRRNGYGKFTSAEGWRYEGEYVDSKFQGKGTYYFENGDTYEGDFVAGNFHGNGKYTFADGRYYTGTWENDKNVTRSATQSAGGSAYTAPQATSARTSSLTTGRQTFDDGSYYEGELLNGYRHGQGSYHWANGDLYEGAWVNGKRNGYGTLKTYRKIPLTGKVEVDTLYEGMWKDSKKHGKGKYTKYAHDNVDSYTVEEGEWIDGNKEGRFRWYTVFPYSSKAPVSYLNYYRRGYLVYNVLPYDLNAQTYRDLTVLFHRERTQEAAKLTCAYYPLMKPVFFCVDSDSINYVEQDGDGNGWGSYIGSDGIKYAGTFRYGLPDGFGHCDLPGGAWYTGEFKLGKLYGDGVYFDGKSYHIGHFEDNLCETERKYIRDIGTSPKRVTNGGITLCYSGLYNLILNENGYGFAKDNDSGDGWCCIYNIEHHMLTMGKSTEMGSITDPNGLMMFASPDNISEICLIRGVISESHPAGRVTSRYFNGTIAEADCSTSQMQVLSKKDWRGNDTE